MDETFNEQPRKPFDAILAEEMRLKLEGAVVGNGLEALSIEFAQMAWEWRIDLNEAEELDREWE